jgi:hypothetical protein
MDSEKRIFVIPHFHYDAAWITTERNNLNTVYEILGKVIEVMRKNEDFKYVIDQVFYLEKMKTERSKLFSQLVDRIREGRIEVVNAGYLMPDLNLVSPSVIKKNYEMMNNFAKKEFGVKPEVAWMIDCFGHPGIMPKIAREADLKYYVFWRGMNEPKSTQDFYWRGSDGVTVLTHWLKRGYSLFGYDFYDLMKALPNLDPTTELAFMPFGCDFCFPHEELIKQVLETKGAKFALPSEFFRELEKYNKNLPVVNGEMLSDYSNFKGYYSSRISFKQFYKKIENELLTRESDEGEWKNLLYAASHDFISGTGIDEVYPNAEEKLKEIKISKEIAEKGNLYEGKFLDKISFELEAEEGDLYHTIPSGKAVLSKNDIKLKANLKDSVLELIVQINFQYPRHNLKLIVKTGIRNGSVIHHLNGSDIGERSFNTLYPLNSFLEYKDQDGNGLRFCTDDCFNYEVKNNGDIHFILVRSVQILSHGDAGPRIPCPKALELGRHKFKLFISDIGEKSSF